MFRLGIKFLIGLFFFGLFTVMVIPKGNTPDGETITQAVFMVVWVLLIGVGLVAFLAVDHEVRDTRYYSQLRRMRRSRRGGR